MLSVWSTVVLHYRRTLRRYDWSDMKSTSIICTQPSTYRFSYVCVRACIFAAFLPLLLSSYRNFIYYFHAFHLCVAYQLYHNNNKRQKSHKQPYKGNKTYSCKNCWVVWSKKTRTTVIKANYQTDKKCTKIGTTGTSVWRNPQSSDRRCWRKRVLLEWMEREHERPRK